LKHFKEKYVHGDITEPHHHILGKEIDSYHKKSSENQSPDPAERLSSGST